jgi:nitrilase
VNSRIAQFFSLCYPSKKAGELYMSSTEQSKCLTVGIAQISPVWLNRELTLDKITEYVGSAAQKNCELIVFGEALLPGYPFLDRTHGWGTFNSSVQKEIHAHYLQNAVQIEAGHLNHLCETATQPSNSRGNGLHRKSCGSWRA